MFTAPSARKPGQLFVSLLMVLTLFWVALYIFLHATLDPKESFVGVNLNDSFRLTPQGEFVLIDANAVKWVLGENTATPILQRLENRTKTIRQLLNDVRENNAHLRNSLKKERSPATNSHYEAVLIIERALSASQCDKTNHCDASACSQTSCNVWNQAYFQLSPFATEYANLESYERTAEHLEEILTDIGDLRQQSNEQFADMQMITPNRAKSFFWSSPAGTALEVIFFSVFGVLANLLVSAAEYLRQGNFKQSERWVAYTKMIYGPILAWILVTAIAFGWLDLGDYEVGVYSLPLVAFFLGFYSRRTVKLFDKLGKKLIGQAEQSVIRGPAEITARRKAYMTQFMSSLSARSIPELKTSAFQVKNELVKTIVMERELQK